jgi:hypothetical protein
MSSPAEDPLLSNARREALIVGGVWLTAMTYTVGYCAAFGYGPDTRELKLVWGFPDWVFWGIVTPWVACVVFGIWFAYAYMSDDDVNAGALGDSARSDHDLWEHDAEENGRG